MINTSFEEATALGGAATGRAKSRSPAPVYVDVAHHLPGRLRLKAASFKGNARATVKVRRALAGVDGVKSVAANLSTGSLLIEYDPNILSPSNLIKRLAKHGYVTGPVGTRSQTADRQADVGCAQLVSIVGWLVANALVGRAMDALIAALI